jgi:hypothetical protein
LYAPAYDPYYDQDYGGRQPRAFSNQTIHPRLFVGSLPPDSKEEEIKEMFAKYGTVVEFYLNAPKNFAFIRMDTRDGSHRAQLELDGKTVHNRQIRVKRAPHPACIWVGKLPTTVSNDLLAEAFSIFGEIERAVVACDERGKARGWGLVEFKRKSSVANAVKRCTEGHLLLTSSFQPVKVEPWNFVDDEVGIDHKALAGYPGVEQQLNVPPRLSRPGELDHTFAEKWKKLFEEELKLKSDMKKIIADKRVALEQEQDLAIRDLYAKRRKEWEDREREMREREMREMREREDRMRMAAMAPPPHAQYPPPPHHPHHPPPPQYPPPRYPPEYGPPMYDAPEMRRPDPRYDLGQPDPYYQAAWEGKPYGPPPAAPPPYPPFDPRAPPPREDRPRNGLKRDRGALAGGPPPERGARLRDGMR